MSQPEVSEAVTLLRCGLELLCLTQLLQTQTRQTGAVHQQLSTSIRVHLSWLPQAKAGCACAALGTAAPRRFRALLQSQAPEAVALLDSSQDCLCLTQHKQTKTSHTCAVQSAAER